ncbi:MAG: 2-hydroxyacyl-CoA dehydratase [Desulfobacterota bacterium]|nr:2-hydroxyacyl-CoA dehydratase [Thermodesulfobacteriota bacterium]MDW8002814.1 2-hydroxyacyl-CoA dehydratase [Deltaproteobacteria bacterium]
MSEIVGFTTTIPVEVIFASKYTPCDLNNIFISDPCPMHYIEIAEKDGFPKNICSWIKGIYGVVMEKKIKTVIAVMVGDCSNTHALSEILQHKGIRVLPFAYPFDKDSESLKREIEKLMRELSVDEKELAKIDREILKVRRLLRKIDELTYKEGLVSGYENHLWLVRASDMMGDFKKYGKMAKSFILEKKGSPKREGVRLGYIGVPPIITDLYEFVEKKGGYIVFNETQRQFSLPFFGCNIVERYLRYTYPYGIFARIEDIKREIRRRKIKGIIHYVQAFCFRVMEDVILKDILDVPMLTIEGELPKPLDARTKLRIEAFLEMLKT